MASQGVPADPEPHEDMVSDMLFGTWLEGLDPEVVARDRESGLNRTERDGVAYVRKKALRYSHPQSEIDLPLADRPPGATGEETP